MTRKLAVVCVVLAVGMVRGGTYSGGDGTEGNPYQISTVADWQELMAATEDWNKHLVLTADLDLAAVSLTPVGNYPTTLRFTGVFDGAGRTVSHAVVHRPSDDYVGLFGCVGWPGRIKNLGLLDADVQGDSHVGSLAGRNYGGTITSCYATGCVSGNELVGGLVGYNDYTSLRFCYAMVYVHANGAVGGLLGWNHRGQVNHCYSTGRPVGAASVGGLCGGVTTGGGYEDTGNFWDIGASQTIESAMGTGRTTREMQTLSTFSDAGWDFLLTWSIDEGTDYPRLKWWPPTGTYSGGDGTEDDPYRIGTTADLQELIGTPGDWDKRFVLTSNLDAAGELLAPVGDNTVPFTGAFNGAGRTISNIVINRPGDDCVGPFGYVGLGGRIENLTVVNVYVRGRGDIGGLVGFNDIGRITGCRATGTVVGTGWRVGGLVGGSYRGTTEYCYAECSVTGSGQVGGLIGHCDDGQTVACDAAGKVAGTGHYVGGLVGYSHGTPLHFCSAAACVSGTGDYVGGLAGYTSYHVSCCYATGTVSGTENVGGLVGYAHEYDGTFVNSYATGAVNGSRAVGGLVGRVHLGKIAHCYSTGKPAGIEYVGGLCGRSITGGQGNFWDTETSETTVSTMAAGRTTEQMQMRSTFLDAGWDFGQTWAICEGTNYPRLRWSIPAGDLLCPDGVSFEDMGYFAGRWLMEDCGLTGGCDGADLTGDGRVDMGDLAILGGSWGQP